MKMKMKMNNEKIYNIYGEDITEEVAEINRITDSMADEELDELITFGEYLLRGQNDDNE